MYIRTQIRARTARTMPKWRRHMYGTIVCCTANFSSRPKVRSSILSPIEINCMTSAFAVVFNGLDFFRRPTRHFEIVRDDTRAPFFNCFSRMGRTSCIALRQDIRCDHVSGGVILFQNVAVDNTSRSYPVPCAGSLPNSVVTRDSSSSTPVALALNFDAAMNTMRPSPLPRSNIFSPGFSP